MDISSSVTSALSVQAGGAIGVTVLKKALEIEAENMMTLLNALSQPQNLPPHLGQNVNTTA